MKLRLLTLLFAVALYSCTQKEQGKIYSPRSLTEKENFNQFQKGTEQPLTIYKYAEQEGKAQGGEHDRFGVKFRDTTVRIQLDPQDKDAVADHFALAEFLNTQKTSLLVQIADHSGLTAPFYLISVKDGKLEVVSIYRPSSGGDDQRFTRGLSRVGRSGYLINNDFFITTVDAKVYAIKRQNPDERIQGLYFINSTDKKTLVFLLSSSLYQVNYPTGEVYTQPLPAGMPKAAAQVFPWVQNNFSWQTDSRGISFLKKNKDDNRIIDIKDFKKS
ncbi:hypothetical protein SAMN06265348_10489 [Pedobacter westerhofensis]|uniref:Uncharacterized protein n=1 Tax=Pedobacter westerhofensis TaxID=425512 RepID=A0A521CPD6_9SPHI|nr:hypothetical protein [Pedobacter westerhofensis]SMO61245.1 hypothetical protein SAMN06265348_10489 [Pedobacter westerhofensis]